MTPVKFDESNCELQAPKGMANCGSLPVFKSPDMARDSYFRIEVETLVARAIQNPFSADIAGFGLLVSRIRRFHLKRRLNFQNPKNK